MGFDFKKARQSLDSLSFQDRISEKLREELLNYLRLDQVDEVENLDRQDTEEGA